MKIAFTSTGNTWGSSIDPRFGRTEYFFLYDEDTGETEVFDNTSVAEQQHGVGPKTAQKLYELGAKILITGNGPGDNAKMILNSMNVEIFVGAEDMSVKEAYNAYKSNELKEF